MVHTGDIKLYYMVTLSIGLGIILYYIGSTIYAKQLDKVRPLDEQFDQQEHGRSKSEIKEHSKSEIKHKSPHIVLIVADDLGFNDVEYHNRFVKTPTLKALAKDGVRLENYYVQPICSPTRSQLLSGRYQIHTGLQHGIITSSTTQGVPVGLPLISDKLRDAGYTTHAIGKWHIGLAKRQYWPTYRGFDTFFGFLNGDEDHYTRRHCHRRKCGRDIRNNTDKVLRDSGKYSTNLFADKAIDIIEKHDSNKPLFLYLAFSAPHAPLQAPDKYIQLYNQLPASKRRTFLGMVTALDEAVRNVTKSLKKSGLWNNTVLVFTTDNGGCFRNGGTNHPLRKGKGSYFEGGVRAVGFVTSPLLRHEVRGTVSRDLMHVTDWFPTFMGLAKLNPATQKGLDGVSQWNTLNGLQKSPRSEILINIDVRHKYDKPIFNDTFDSSINAGLRVDRWKLLTGQSPGRYAHNYDISSKKYKNVYLFDIKNDPLEDRDLSGKRPDMVKKLLDRLQDYHKTSVPQQSNKADKRSDPSRHGGFWDSWI